MAEVHTLCGVRASLPWGYAATGSHLRRPDLASGSGSVGRASVASAGRGAVRNSTFPTML